MSTIHALDPGDTLHNWVGADLANSSVSEAELREGQLERELVELYRGHAAGIWRCLSRMGLVRELAQEALQEAFLRYFVARRAGIRIGCPQAWLYKAGRNYAIDRLRRRDHQVETPLEAAAQQACSGPSPEEIFVQQQLQHLIRDNLTDRESECWYLRIEGFSYAEIAEAMGVRPGTVGALINRAVVKLKGLFASSVED